MRSAHCSAARFFVLLLLGELGTHAAADPGRGGGALERWLHKVQVRLPNITVWPDFQLSDILCGNVSVASIDHRAEAAAARLHVGATDFGLRCTAAWNMIAHGQVVLAVSGAHFRAAVEVDGAPGLITGLRVPADMCAVDFVPGSIDIHVKGALPSGWWERIEPSLNHMVQEELQTKLCNESEGVAKQLSPSINEMNQVLAKYTTTAPPASTPVFPDGVVDLRSSKLGKVLTRFINGTIGDVHGRFGVGTLLRPYDDLNVTVPMNRTLGVGNISLSSVRLTGLASVSQAKFFSVSSEQTFESKFTLGAFQVLLKMQVALPPPILGSGGLVESFQVLVNVSSAQVRTGFYAQLSAAALDYTFAQMEDRFCAAHAFSALGLRSVDLKLDGIATVVAAESSGGLEADLSGLVNDGLNLVTTAWEDLLSALVEGSASQLLRDMLSSHLAGALAKLKADGACMPDDSLSDGVNTTAASVFFYLAMILLASCLAVIIASCLADNVGMHIRPVPPDNPPLQTSTGHACCSFGSSLGNRFSDGRVRCWVIPLSILAVGCLYASAKCDLSDTTHLRLAGGSDSITLPDMDEDSFWGFFQRLWREQQHPAAFIWFFIYGMLTFGRVLILLLCWLLPEKILSPRLRGRLLRCLRSIGKWSFQDPFGVLITQMSLSEVHLFPDSSFTFFQDKQWGYHGMVVASVLSLLVTQALLTAHDHVEAKRSRHADSGQPFTPSLVRDTPTWSKAVTAGALALACGLLVWGVRESCFSVTFQGPEGSIFLAEKHISLFGAIGLVSELVPQRNLFATTCTQLSWVFLTMLALLLDQLAILVLSLRLLPADRALAIRQGVKAWACTDVLLAEIFIKSTDPPNSPDPSARMLGKATAIERGFYGLLAAVLLTWAAGVWAEWWSQRRQPRSDAEALVPRLPRLESEGSPAA